MGGRDKKTKRKCLLGFHSYARAALRIVFNAFFKAGEIDSRRLTALTRDLRPRGVPRPAVFRCLLGRVSIKDKRCGFACSLI